MRSVAHSNRLVRWKLASALARGTFCFRDELDARPGVGRPRFFPCKALNTFANAFAAWSLSSLVTRA